MDGSQPRVLDDQGEVLKPYAPRLQIEWLRDAPQTRYRAVEGSLAFVDISGFTALTESLNRRGKIGAELLRDTLDPIFCALLDEAYRWGAGLLKWGGDAMLLLFEGGGHEERAARAAWEMQKTIDTVGRVRVGSTRTTLRMSIGIATGTIDFFLAGSVHRELLVAGPVATETAVIEGAADAGEIGLSPALAERLAPGCVDRSNDTPLLLAPPDADESPAPDVGRVSGVDVASCIPIASREFVLLERREPEHRAVTAVFFDLMNTDTLLGELGPAALAEALDARISSIQDAAARYEVPFNVTDVSKGSVKVLLTAGAPSTTGHDEEQALRLAREVMDRPGLVPLRAGLDAGHVFTGDFGPSYRRTYAVLGDAINTAARVMARAEPGQILATDVVLERSRTTFVTTPIEPFAAKGKAEPVRASLVGPITGRREHRIAETPFVGRGRELEAFRRVLDEVGGNRTAWILEIAGPSGMGKTRLIREALAAAPGLPVFRATCEEYEVATPYHAVRALLYEVLSLEPGSSPADVERALLTAVADADSELVPWVPLLGILLGLDLPPTPETKAIDERFLREKLAELACRFLAARLDAEPFVVVVEDAQFMDDSSADLLRRVAKEGASLPHALVVARTEREGLWIDVEDEESRFLAFNLLPLSAREAAEIVEITTDEEPLRPHEVEELALRSGGSPLFLVELLNLARAAGTTDELPDSVEAVVTADIDRLSPADRIVLRYASVLGVVFDEALLVATLGDEVAPDEALWERLRGLVERDADGRLRFRNSLVRDTAYGGLPFRRRRDLHGRFAEAIESSAASGEDDAATLALHFAAAGRLDRTWHYARAAADRARSIAAHVEAARLYELALSAGRHVRAVGPKDRAEVFVALGNVREIAGLFDSSYDALRRATRLLNDDPVEQARIYAQRTLARQRTGAHSLALRETAVGLRLVERRNERRAIAARALLRAWRAEILMFQGHARKAIPIAEAAVEEGKRVGEFNALAHAYTALDGAYALLGQPEKAVHEKLALEMFRENGNSLLAGIYGFNVGGQAYYNGDWDEAMRLYVQAREDCLRAGDRNNAAYASVCVAELLIGRGELDEAEELLIGARRVLRSSGFAVFALFAETQLARCLLERGDAATARPALEAIAEEAATVGYAGMVLEAGTYVAHAFAREGSGQRGLDALEAAVAAAGSEAAMYGAAIERARAACLVALGRSEEAAVALDRALASALEQGLLYEQLLIRRMRAEPEDLGEIARLAEILGVPR